MAGQEVEVAGQAVTKSRSLMAEFELVTEDLRIISNGTAIQFRDPAAAGRGKELT